MFLVRATMWMLIVMALLPDQRDAFLERLPLLQQQVKQRGVDRWLTESADRAESLVAVCRHQPALCDDAVNVWHDAWQQATEKVGGVLPSWGGSEAAAPLLRRRGTMPGTLNPADMEPAWDAPRA